MGAVLTALKRSVGSFGTDQCATLAAALAYRTIFALFPLALVGVSVLGFFLDGDSARQRVIDGITGVMSLGAEGEQALAGTLEGVNAAKGWLGLIGLATAAWSASGLFGQFRAALDRVWDVDRPLPMLRGKLRDLGLMFGFGGLLGASAGSTGVLQAARQAGATWLGPISTMAGPFFVLLAIVLPLVLTFGAFLFLYKIAPHARLGIKDVIPAAIIATVFFEFGKNLLAYYIQNLSNFNALAGSLGAAILFLVFVYYAAQVVLLGAEFAKHLMLIRAGTVPANDTAAPKPTASRGEKVKGTLKRLWAITETHHDTELPYAPSRQDPAHNRPTNTREEIILKQQQAAQHAAQDAGVKRAAAGAPRTASTIRGEAVLKDGLLSVKTANGPRPLVPTPQLVVTRDGESATLDHIRTGDLLTVQVSEAGALVRVDAQNMEHPPQRNGNAVYEALGILVTLIVRRLADRKQPEGRKDAMEQVRTQATDAAQQRRHTRSQSTDSNRSQHRRRAMRR